MNVLSEMKGRINNLSSSDKSFIENTYKIVLWRQFTKTSCGDCYKDAVMQIYNYLKKNEIMTRKSNYLLKAGVILMMPGCKDIYNNQNLTDDVAERHLKDKPKAINLFESYPEDWEKRIEGEPKAPKVPKEPKAPKVPKVETE